MNIYKKVLYKQVDDLIDEGLECLKLIKSDDKLKIDKLEVKTLEVLSKLKVLAKGIEYLDLGKKN